MLMMVDGEPSVPVTTESDSISLGTIDEVLVASEIGNFSCCDVWVKTPAAWLGRVTVRLYALLGDARLLLRQVALNRVPITSTIDGIISGIAISVRGHPAAAFEVTCQALEGTALEDGFVYLQVWQANVPPYISGGDILPETRVSPPMVAAVLVGRDETTGDLVQISTDSTGRFLMSNPLFTTADRALLDGATDAATPSTLAKRDASGDSHFRHLYVDGIDHEPSPSATNLLIGTESSTTQVTIGSSSSTTTLWNATLEGTTTVVDSTSLQVSDRIVTVNRTAGPNAPVPSQITGISVMRGDISGAKRDFVGLFWDESASVFRLANNTAGDDSTLGSGLPLVATEFRGPASAPAVVRSNSSSDAVQLQASATTLLSVSDSSGTTKLDPGDRPMLVGAAAAASGAGHAYTIQGQQGAAGSVGGNLKLQAGKGGTPGTNAAGDVVFENGQTVGGATGFNRWQANGTDYLTMQQTSVGPTFTTPDGCQLIMKSSGAGTTLNANTGNLNLYGNNLGTLYAAALTLGGSTITWEDVGTNHTIAWNNVRTNWSWTFNAAVTFPTFTQADNTTNGATATGMIFAGQAATGTAATGGFAELAGGTGTAKGGAAFLSGGDGSGNGNGGDACVLGGAQAGSGKDGNVLIGATSATMNGAGNCIFVVDRTSEPTASPSGGAYLFSRPDNHGGQLVSRDGGGFVSEMTTRLLTTGSASVTRLRRANTGGFTANGSTVVILTIPASDLPASGTYSAQATLKINIVNTGNNTSYDAEWRVSWKCIAGTTSAPTAAKIGEVDGTGGALNTTSAVAVTTTGGANAGAVNFAIVSVNKGQVLKILFDVDALIFQP